MTYASTILADTPAAYFRCDDTSGSTLADSSGNSRPLTVNSGTVTFGAAPVSPTVGGSAITTSSAGISDASPSYFNSLTTFSVELWMRGSNFGPLVWRSTQGVAHAQFTLRTDVDAPVFTAISNDVSADSFATGSTSVLDDEWHHIVGTYSSDSKARIYVDGVLSGTGSALGTAVGDGVGGPLMVACNDFSGFFDGDIDEVAFYTYALTGTQVATHYAAAAVVRVCSGTVAATTSGAARSSVSMTAPGTVGSTDLGVAVFSIGTASPVTVTATGWTQVINTSTGTAQTMIVLTTALGSGAGTTFTLNSSQIVAAAAAWYPGMTGIDNISTVAVGNTASKTTNTVTTSTANEVVVGLFAGSPTATRTFTSISDSLDVSVYGTAGTPRPFVVIGHDSYPTAGTATAVTLVSSGTSADGQQAYLVALASTKPPFIGWGIPLA